MKRFAGGLPVKLWVWPGDTGDLVATALMAVPADDLSRLWVPDVTVIWPEHATSDDPAILAFEEEELTTSERRLKTHLDGLREHCAEVGDLPPKVAVLLRRCGRLAERWTRSVGRWATVGTLDAQLFWSRSSRMR